MYGDTTYDTRDPYRRTQTGSGMQGMGEDRSLSFRRLMGRYTTGVAVVLAGGNVPIGLTVNSFTSLSLAPPLILFCARNESRSVRAVIAQGKFSINILADSQRDISKFFAGAADLWNSAACGRHKDWFTIPDANGTLCCDVATVHPGGDHVIVVGAVKEILAPETARRPLLYYEGRYEALELQPAAAG